MPRANSSRYELVSRRFVLKVTLGAGAVAFLPGCSNGDAEVFAGAIADPATTAAPTTAPPTTAQASGFAVDGEMVISFTYTQGSGGRDQRPYVAVWIEDQSGALVQTVALWYEQGRRGDRWLDHLTRWYDGDAVRVASGGADLASTISSATRNPGAYSVVWDGTIDGQAAPAGDYFVCIESAREEGPYSLIREAITLNGSLPETVLADSDELSAASVRIDG